MDLQWKLRKTVASLVLAGSIFSFFFSGVVLR